MNHIATKQVGHNNPRRSSERHCRPKTNDGRRRRDTHRQKKRRSGKAIRPLVVLRPPLPVCTRTFDMISIVQFPCRLSSRLSRNSDVYRLDKNKDGENENVEGVSTGNSHTHAYTCTAQQTMAARLFHLFRRPFFPCVFDQ